MSGANGRPAWANCSYADGDLRQHWLTLGRVRGEDQAGDCFVDLVEYQYGDDDSPGPQVRVGDLVLRLDAAEGLARLIAAALHVVGRD